MAGPNNTNIVPQQAHREPDEDDWVKLKRGLKYLIGTRHIKLVITIDSMHTIHWYVDASYGTHYDFKCHTGIMMTLLPWLATTAS